MGVVRSFILDVAVVALARRLDNGDGEAGESSAAAWFVFATAWPLLTIQLRPFSNSTECLLLALALMIAAQLPSQPAWRRGLCGSLLACGMWNRITFPAFFLPVASYILYEGAQSAGGKGFVAALLQSALGWGLTALAITVVDSLYFGSLVVEVNGGPLLTSVWEWSQADYAHKATLMMEARWPQIGLAGELVVPPVRNMLYNMDSSNLAKHGTHPHYTHGLVNLPLLFGPLALAHYWDLAMGVKTGRLRGILVATVVSGLGLLSAFPHQEPRFLLPLLVPLAVLYGPTISRTRSRLTVWLVFNAICTLLFGFLHQGGVIPAFDLLPRYCPEKGDLLVNRSVFFYKTYTAPPSMALQPVEGNLPEREPIRRCQTQKVVSLEGGASPEDVSVALLEALEGGGEVYLALPASISPTIITKKLRKELHLAGVARLHLSLEDPPVWEAGLGWWEQMVSLREQMQLKLYRIGRPVNVSYEFAIHGDKDPQKKKCGARLG